ncbi:MAG: GNAT family N-acetyltransferase [Anaerolineales bacterium]|nr:GNAT family N-acetyltransferase [Anaerolineales bacterium]
MKIFEDPNVQCLLCTGYEFEGDFPLLRERQLDRYRPGVRQKEWWRYHHNYLGLKTLVAYQGVKPVGHIEFMPIDYVPRPISGQDILIINCIHVAEPFKGQGIGRALLGSVEDHAQRQAKGVAVLSRNFGSFMPLSYFEKMKYQPVDERDDETLMFKPIVEVEAPAFLTQRYEPEHKENMINLDYFHCPQCPMSGYTLEGLQKHLKSHREEISLTVFEMSERKDVEQFGIAEGIFIDGVRVASLPYDVDQLISLLDMSLETKDVSVIAH